MQKRAVVASAIMLSSPAWAAEPASAQDGPVAAAGSAEAQERAEMMRQIQELKSRISTLEANQKSAPPPVQDHNLELYGYAQLDAIQDFNRVDPDWESTLRPSRIPTDEGAYGGDGQSIFSIRQSRLGVLANGTLAGKPYEARFEFDLFGTGSDVGQTTFKIRHAYGSWGPLLAGQTWTLFMDADIVASLTRLAMMPTMPAASSSIATSRTARPAWVRLSTHQVTGTMRKAM